MVGAYTRSNHYSAKEIVPLYNRLANAFGKTIITFAGSDILQIQAFHKKYRQEFMNNLHKKPPVYIVVAPLSEVILGGRYELSDFLVFEKFIATKYKEEVRFGDLILYRRKAI